MTQEVIFYLLLIYLTRDIEIINSFFCIHRIFVEKTTPSTSLMILLLICLSLQVKFCDVFTPHVKGFEGQCERLLNPFLFISYNRDVMMIHNERRKEPKRR